MELLQRVQNDDPWIQRIKETIQQSKRGFKIWSITPSGLLLWKGRIYVPKEAAVRRELLELYHDDPLAGHFGRVRTKGLLERYVHWEGIDRDVREHVSSCPQCQGTAIPRHKPYGQLQTLPLPKGPMQELSMDFITNLPPTRNSLTGQLVDSILVIVDRFTKYVRFIPVSTTINVAELAEVFYREWELDFSSPKGILTDRGSVFTSAF